MAVKINEIYKCEICGNIVAAVHGGQGSLVCCGQNMVLLEEKTAEMATEKHVPVVEIDGNKVKVTVGSTIHPMLEKHYIEWIEILTEDGRSYRKFLEPEQEPVAEFVVESKVVKAREHCNLHGLWINTV
ncbi:MAG: desulfoferrodoxin [Candidatus Heimdallarchaeaceae archaeon]